ncbi:hypothetical protein P280DRAFT_271922 [Massarina eburnea CBS 473.64]|uniref:Uncharacterized protein n=1 Tax=Massarina eburnea CBS 473.64 TaxID=1395130 RepID=A0A6A6S8F1_9PLEO|nr:hypothetical protein P280DRAFT_271922 [Massarina eburnea CBS 473.64]
MAVLTAQVTLPNQYSPPPPCLSYYLSPPFTAAIALPERASAGTCTCQKSFCGYKPHFSFALCLDRSTQPHFPTAFSHPGLFADLSEQKSTKKIQKIAKITVSTTPPTTSSHASVSHADHCSVPPPSRSQHKIPVRLPVRSPPDDSLPPAYFTVIFERRFQQL